MNTGNLYLHFLDRELKSSVRWQPTEKVILEAILYGLCLTSGRLFCSYSHFWESYPLFTQSLSLLRDMVKARIVVPTSNFATSDEFLARRIVLYQHDRKRYPMYFKAVFAHQLAAIQPVHVVKTGATESLVRSLGVWTEGQLNPSNASYDRARKIVHTGLQERKGEAVTAALFARHAKMDKEVLSIIRRLISMDYTKHYMESCKADILTGIQGLALYDSLAVRFPFYDTLLFKALLEFTKVELNTEADLRRSIEGVVMEMNHPVHGRLQMLWDTVIRHISGGNISIPSSFSDRAVIQSQMLSRLRRLDACSDLGRKRCKFSLSRIVNVLESLIAGAGQQAVGGVGLLSKGNGLGVKVVFLVATDTEQEKVFEVLKSRNVHLDAVSLPLLSAWKGDLGGNREIWLVRSEMGSLDQSGSMLTTSDIIHRLDPDFIIMPGIAFGLRPEKQKLGDILVGKFVSDYETLKVTDTDSIDRGAKPECSAELLSKARMVGKMWTLSAVHIGQVVSGCKLSNSQALVDELRNRYPEAIGGEMEGTGLASTCQRHQVQWVLIKAICDWGVKKDDAAQNVAASNAVEFCFRIVDLLPQNPLPE